MYLKILFGLLDGWVVTYLPPYSNLHLPSRKFPFFHGKPVLARSQHHTVQAICHRLQIRACRIVVTTEDNSSPLLQKSCPKDNFGSSRYDYDYTTTTIWLYDYTTIRLYYDYTTTTIRLRLYDHGYYYTTTTIRLRLYDYDYDYDYDYTTTTMTITTTTTTTTTITTTTLRLRLQLRL